MKIVAGADWHLDATMVGGWDAQAGIHSNWVESLRQLDAVVDLANEVEAELLVVAGDVYHTGRPTAEIVARTVERLNRLETAKVVFAGGNHDQQTVVLDHRTPLDAYLSNHPWCYASLNEPGVVDYEGLKLALVPWLKVAGSSQLKIADADLIDAVNRLGDEVAGSPSLLFGHLVVAEAMIGSDKRGSEVGMSTSVLEASVPTKVLEAGPWSRYRLGHVHRRQELGRKGGYIGAPYKVTFGERDDPKGAEVIEINEDGSSTVEFRRFATRELIQADVSNEGGESVLAIAEQANPGDIVRLQLDADGEPRNWKKALRILESKGIEPQTPRKPKPRPVAVERAQSLGLDTDHATAFQVYLDVQGVEPEERAALTDLFADLSVTAA